MNVIATIFWGLIVLIVLVVIHEWGHFIAARRFGVRVTEFMIGLPGPNIGFEHNGTKYGITAIPLGGYNRITGMESGPEDPNLEQVLAYTYRQGKADPEHAALACGITEDEAEIALMILDGWGSVNEPGRDNKSDYYCAPKTAEYSLGEPREVPDPKALLDSERAQTYRGLPFWKRFVVLFAGPFMNVLLAFVLLLVLFCGIGVTQSTTTISQVADGGAAQAAGLQAGDTITAIDGTATPDWASLSKAISGLSAGQNITVGYQRDGADHEAKVKVGQSGEGTPQLGIYASTETVRLGPIEALQASWGYLVLTVQSYASLLNPATAASTISQSSSVVGIAVMSERAASAGIAPLLYIVAVISLSLGIVNLVPMPPLDGGKILVEIIQRITHRAVPVKVINAITIVVILLLLLLFVVMLRQDIVRFVLGG